MIGNREHGMLAIFPALIAVVTIYGLVANPADVARQVGSFAKSLPPGAGDLLTNQLQKIISTNRGSLSIALVISIAGAVWSASAGTQALIKGLNSNFGKYNQTYGWLGAVIVLLLWLWLSALAALIGAELDAQIEREAARQTQAPRRAGERGTAVADAFEEFPRR